MGDVGESVVIAGAGVAGLEATLCLLDELRDRADVTLLSGTSEFVFRAVGVGESFGLARARRHALAPLARDLGVALLEDPLTAVDPAARTAALASGRLMPYGHLVIAVGAGVPPPSPYPVVFDRQRNAAAFDAVVAELQAGEIGHVAFVVPPVVTWPLPAYELALMSAAWGANSGVEVSLVTPEERPLAMFGRTASAAVAGVLERAGVRFDGGADPAPDTVRADRVVALPEIVGPALPGLPAGERGFLGVDAWGRVPGAPGVYAIGDAADHPVKQGGLAAQQAAVAARAIAHDCGARDQLDPPRPVLRGLLRTIEGPLYLRASLDDVEGTSTASSDPLWWPPAKLAAPRLTSHLARLERARIHGAVLPTAGVPLAS